MGLYEAQSEGYIDPTDATAKEMSQYMDNFYEHSYTPNAAFWQQAYIDKRFKVGDQSLNNLLYGSRGYYNARRFFFNMIRRHINMIVGYQRRNRKSTIVVPRTSNVDDPLADDYNTCIRWSEDFDGFQEYLSQSFEGACDVGMNLLHMYLDYTQDPVSGDLKTDQVAYNNFLIDPYFRKQDLSDCNGIWRRRWVTKEAAKSLLPGHEKEISRLCPRGVKDGKFYLQAELLNLDVKNLMTYDEFHYRSDREATFIIDPKARESYLWEPDPDAPPNELKHILTQQPWLKTKKKRIPTVKLVLSINGKVMYHGANLLGIDRYPFAPSLCYYEPDMQSYAWRCQGVVRNLRDAQYLYNRRKVIELDILESQANSGWIYPVDVVTDEKAFRQTEQGVLVPLKAGHLPNEVERIAAPDIPQSLIELSRSLSENITQISGVNEELLGAADDQKAGILSMLRQSAGLTTLNTILDRIDYTQRIYGGIRLEAIRKNYSRGKVQSILGKKEHPNFFGASAQKYQMAVEQGNYSTTQQQMELQQLLHFREIGMPIPDKSIMRKAIIGDKQQVMQDMEEQSQAQSQAQEAQAQADEKDLNSKVMERYAKARSQLAKEKELMASTSEKMAKIEENQATAEQKSTEADLNLVKMMIELEDLDLRNLKNAIELAEQVRLQKEQPQGGYYGLQERAQTGSPYEGSLGTRL